jgi:hypothetical protein
VIVNPHSVLAAFVSFVEAALAAATLGLALAALRSRAAPGSEAAADRRYHLLFLLALTLAAVGVAAWPLLYLTLASYVSEWPGVMCIQGVTRVGTGSLGAAGWLPGLVTALAVLRPAAVLAAGSWLALHVANRRTRTAPLTRRVLVLVAAAGAVSLAAGTCELAYLFIPKVERFLSDGCCTMPDASAAKSPEFRPFLAWFGETSETTGATAAFFASGAVLAALTAWRGLPRNEGVPARAWVLALAAGASVFAAIGAAFATEAASPAILHLPHHHCVWCLLATAPECVVGVALVLTSALCAGWAAVVAWGAGHDEARAAGPRQVRTLVLLALFGVLASLVFAAAELVSA